MSPDVRIAQLTPPGRAALATLAISGPAAADLVESHFQPASGRAVRDLVEDRIVFGSWKHDDGSQEELVVVRRGKTTFEVHCHGGAAALHSIRDGLLRQGAESIEASEWVRTQPLTRIQMEAWQQLSQARTERAAGILLQQYHGALEAKSQQIVESAERNQWEEARVAAAALVANARAGVHLCDPWRVVISGPPNVGKSSLLNALVGFERAIVYGEPGTTRDAIRVVTVFDGWLVELVDTAGIRASQDHLEAEGIRRAEAQRGKADLVLEVIDATNPSARPKPASDSEASSLRVRNKCDLVPSVATSGQEILVSALTGDGLESLRQAIVQELALPILAPEEGVPFTARQQQQCLALLAASESRDLGALQQAAESLVASDETTSDAQD